MGKNIRVLISEHALSVGAVGGKRFSPRRRQNALAAARAGCAHGLAMTDYFAALGQLHRPWLEPEALKEAFHRRSAALHPDVPETGNAAQFAALNAAHSALREPATRVRHLLELVAPAAFAGAVAPPAELGDLFMQLAGLRRRLDELLAHRAEATVPLTRALLAANGAALRREFAAVLAELEWADSGALGELRELDSRWNPSDGEVIRALSRLYHRLAYLARWLAQTHEALFRLEN